MGPSMMFAAVMQISSSFSVGAICNALAGFPSTDYCASTIVTHIMDYGNNRYEMGYACAIATVFVFDDVFDEPNRKSSFKKVQ